ncbi:hypothetical protein EPA93_30245 [Ktedonosporobacter rubrisoli]|uniref:Fructose-6-phosphate aldolase n=1 Tax=Ktedonosporobacter rubrisoli TaxID=2509675 RepID=A0A4P6JWR2_KTERU|nr:transaldolase family protein [Ktedonosporobacter rubrisoli]QBD80034.1 hypothetical protein EPA93_30245 [Ktedonosporobacter rubrisoli]
MALYIDCAYLDDITQVCKTIPVAGVTTNPSLMLNACQRGQKLSPRQLLQELLARIEGTIFIQPGETEEEEAVKEALSYIELAPERVIPKIPMTQTGMRIALQLKSARHRIAFTAITTVAQVYCATMAQADYVIPYYNRLTSAGVDARERITDMVSLLEKQQLPTRVLAASLKSSIETSEALLAGAHDLTAAPSVLLEMVRNPQSEQAVEKFKQDWQKMKTL